MPGSNSWVPHRDRKGQWGSRSLTAAVLLSSVLVLTACAGLSREGKRGADSVVGTLTVSAPRENLVLFQAPAARGELLHLEYVHSVSKSPVRGVFRITGRGAIEPVTTTFTSYGPGLPWPADGDRHVIEDGQIVVHHDEQARAELRLWVSGRTDDHMRFAGYRFPLFDAETDPRLIVLETVR